MKIIKLITTLLGHTQVQGRILLIRISFNPFCIPFHKAGAFSKWGDCPFQITLPPHWPTFKCYMMAHSIYFMRHFSATSIDFIRFLKVIRFIQVNLIKQCGLATKFSSCRSHLNLSWVIRYHQKSSEVIRCHQRSSEVVRRHHNLSEVIQYIKSYQKSWQNKVFTIVLGI